jgi:4'-phosphopantetheinyl transferase
MGETDFSWQSGSGPASLSLSKVHVWKISLEQPPERVRALCRGYLRMLLSRYAGIAPEQVQLKRGTHGKLTLDPHIHKEDIEFNVSHSGQVALIALARGRPLGVDVAKVGTAARIDAILRGFFSAQEDTSIRSLPEEMKTAAFYSCWTRKEAAVKALGGSIAELRDKIIVSTFPGGPAQILRMPSSSENNEWHLHDLPVGEGYSAALCYGGPPAEVFLWQPDE